MTACLFRWSADLKGASAHVRGLDHWKQIEAQRIVPRLTEAVQALDEGITGPLAERWRDWRNRYLPELRTLLSLVRRAQKPVYYVTTGQNVPNDIEEASADRLARMVVGLPAAAPARRQRAAMGSAR